MPSALETAILSHRRRLLAGDQRVLDALTRAYAPVRQRLVAQIDALTAEIAATGATEGTAAFKLERATVLLSQVEAELARLAAGANGLVAEGQRQAVGLAGEAARSLVMAQAPRLAAEWVRVPTEAVADLVGRLSDGSPLADWLARLGPEASAAIREGLVSGLATGQHPRVIARDLAGKLDVAATRLLATARNAVIGSYSSAAIANYAANQDILEDEWEWICAKQARTCAACLSLDGTRHKISDGFQKRHSQCRCASLPLVKGAPPIERELGRDWLAKQDAATQDRILGTTGGADYRAGTLDLDDFATLRRNARWGDSYQRATLAEARANAAKRGRVAA